MPGCSACGGGNGSNKNYSMKSNIVKRTPVIITNVQQYQQYQQRMRQLQYARRCKTHTYGLKF